VSRPGTRPGRAFPAGLLAGLLLALSAPGASAVTIGQLAPAPSDACSPGPFDLVQRSVESGASYVVPATGGLTSWTVTSWSTNASADPAQTQSLKFFRKVAEPGTYTVVSREGPHALVPGLNVFPADLEVHPGDILGSNWDAAGDGAGACDFPGSGGFDFRTGDLAVGATDAFMSDFDFRVNISAEITPTSDFTVRKPKAKPNGTAVLALTIPNPGDLTVSGKGVKGSVKAVGAKQVSAGKVKVVIRARGKKKQTLDDTGKVTVKPKITFTPTGGAPHGETRKIKLRRK
jgi:hypothetical protein